jgi:hypothetical protein
MSIKTTLKRIALVAVSALGLGLLGFAPSQAANTTAAAFTTNITLNTSYLTVVADSSTPSASVTETGATSGFFYFDVTNESASASQSPATRGLALGFETAVVEVLTAPTGKLTTDLAFAPVKVESDVANTTPQLRYIHSANAADTWTSVLTFDGQDIARNESCNLTPAVGNLTGTCNRYWFGVSLNGSTAAIGSGYYTVRIRVTTADNGQTITKTLNVKFVETYDDADAKVTVTGSGTLFTGETLSFATGRNYSATLSGATNGDRIVKGVAVARTRTDGTESATVQSSAPTMNAALTDVDGVLITGSNLVVRDSGTAGDDHIAPATAVTGSTLPSDSMYAASRNIANGVYGITSTAVLPSLADLSTNKIRVRLNNSSVAGTLTVTTATSRSAGVTSANFKIAGTGVKATDTAFAASATSAAASGATKAYTLPLSANAVTLTIDIGDTAAYNVTTTTTWSGNFASANVSPAASSTGVVSTTATDSNGQITREITNSSPVAGAVATVVVTGFADTSHKITVTLTWAAPVVTTVTVIDPISGIHTALKGTTTFSVRVRDQFLNNMAGEVLQPIVGGSTGVGNYSATTTYATIKTDANGVATWSLTDAAAEADETDSITFKSISNSTVSSDAYTITYKTTVAVVSSFLKYYNLNWGDGTIQATINTSVPATGITNGTSKLVIPNDVNLSNGLLAAYDDAVATDAAVAIRLRANTSAGLPAAGAAVTVTAASGGHIVGTSGTPVSTRTFAVPSTGDVSFQVLATAPGLIKFTVTSGTATDSFSLDVANPDGAAARTISITGAATGTANGEGVPMTVKVSDRYGNGVSNVLLTVAASGVGSFSGGATTQSYTTDTTGTYTFLGTSLVSAGGTGTFSASIATAGTAATSAAGYHLTTVVDSTLAAGVTNASAAVTFAAGQSKSEAAAEAATDAALEAIDAANAATDAANLAAEAADAATVAAEEARDAADAATAAVEALASEVATLMAALKAQITTLANTVAKIAKKIRA